MKNSSLRVKFNHRGFVSHTLIQPNPVIIKWIIVLMAYYPKWMNTWGHALDVKWNAGHNAVDCSETLYLTASNAPRLSLVEVEG